MIKTKTIISGAMLECEVYPVWQTGETRKGRGQRTKLSQQKLNHRNAVKRMIRLINTNFTKEGIWMTLTYRNKPSEATAKRAIQNYIRRLKRRVNHLKYIYVTEIGEKRVHHHIVLNMNDRDMAESLWHLGRTNARRLQPDDYGLEGLARYISKGLSKRRYICSLNLEQPIIFEDTDSFTNRDKDGLVRDYEKARQAFEARYTGYIFRDMQVKESQLSGWYIYARLQRQGGET